MSERERIESVVFHPITPILVVTAVLLKPAAVFVTRMGWSMRLGNFVLLVLLVVSLPYILWAHSRAG